jgi:hypothetical protein
MWEQRAFTAYLSPYTQTYKWTDSTGETAALAEETALNGGLALLTKQGWELISATYRPINTGDVLTGEYTLFCRKSGGPAD